MSNIQDLLKSAITNGVVDPARSAFLLAQASTAIDRLEARLVEAEARIARLLEITESCEWCFKDARATDSAPAVERKVLQENDGGHKGG